MKKICEGGAKVSGFFCREETPNALEKNLGRGAKVWGRPPNFQKNWRRPPNASKPGTQQQTRRFN